MPKRTDIHKVLIIGSGPIIIGQACEFDYSGTQACKALRKLGYEIVLVNSNPATIMTDPETADVTYIEPLNVDRLEQIIAKERPDALLPNLGGQSGLNLCSELNKAGILEKYNVKVIGVQVDAIERGEDRIEFKKTMNKLGIEMARSEVAYSVEEALAIAEKLGYPVVLRPAYTMGGAGGGLVYNKEVIPWVSSGMRNNPPISTSSFNPVSAEPSRSSGVITIPPMAVSRVDGKSKRRAIYTRRPFPLIRRLPYICPPNRRSPFVWRKGRRGSRPWD